MILNFDKVQKDFLTAALKTSHDRTKHNDWIYSHSEEKKMIILSDGHFIAAVPESMCFVNAQDDCGVRILQPQTFEKMVPSFYDQSERLTDSMTTRQITGAKTKVHILTTENGEEIKIDEKYYSYFSSMDEKQFFCKGKKNPVYVFVYDQFVGCILPII